MSSSHGGYRGRPATPKPGSSTGTLDRAGSIIGATRAQRAKPNWQVTSGWCLCQAQTWSEPGQKDKETAGSTGRQGQSSLGDRLLLSLSLRESSLWGEEGPLDDPRPIRDKTASDILSRAARGGEVGNVICARGMISVDRPRRRAHKGQRQPGLCPISYHLER